MSALIQLRVKRTHVPIQGVLKRVYGVAHVAGFERRPDGSLKPHEADRMEMNWDSEEQVVDRRGITYVGEDGQHYGYKDLEVRP